MGAEVTSLAAVPRARSRGWRVPVLVTAALIAAGFAYSMLLMPWVLHLHAWWFDPESFFPVYAGRYVANGAYPWLYEAERYWVAGPLLPVVLAPVAAVQEAFHLSDNGRYAVDDPTLWPVFLPYGLSAFALVAHGARTLAAEGLGLGDLEDRRLVRLQWILAILVGVPVGVVIGHFEDLFALGLLLLASRDAVRGSRRGGALWLGLAIGFKQWSLLALPVLFVLQRRERRLRWLVAALGLPAVAYGIPLAVDPAHAGPALLQARVWPALGHASLAVRSSAAMVGTPFRVGSVLAAMVTAVVLARTGRRDARTVAAALGVLFLIRLAFEPTVFGYYPSPALAFLAVHEVLAHGRTARTLALGTAMLMITPAHPDPYVWWAVFVGLAVALAWEALPDLRPHAGGPAAPAQRTKSNTNDVVSTA